MKKILIFSCFLVLMTSAYGATAISGGYQNRPAAVNSYNPNATINTKALIQGQQDSIRSKYFNRMVPNNEQKPTPAPPPAPPQHGGKKHYIPHTYGIEYVNNNKDKQNVTINNTYNYYNSPSDNNNTKTELTQKQKDEIERKALRKKYAAILSNTTMENSKICSKMAEQFPSASKDELDRILNKILRLNCNISKLR